MSLGKRFFMCRTYSLHFRKNGRCVEKLFHDPYSLVRYLKRYHGTIKDYCCVPRYCVNADKVLIWADSEDSTISFVCLCELGCYTFVEEAILHG